jgi:hypothetical protein
MRRKRKSLFGGISLPNVMFRMLLDIDGDPFAGAGGAGAASPPPAAPIVEADIPPTNGGPDRGIDDGSSGVSDTSGSGNLTAPPAARPIATDPNNRAGAASPPPAAPANDWQSIRDAAVAMGYQFPANLTDDRQALTHLLQQAQANRQSDVYAQLGRRLAPQAGDIQQFLATKNTPAAPTRQPWEAPEFDERWAGLVERNEATGLYVSKPGVPHEIANKVNSYVEWKAGYDRDPAKVINGMVESRAKAIAEQTFREQFQAQANDQTINSIVQENSAWLYQANEQGQRVQDISGRPILSPVGARYIHHLTQIKQMGVTNPRQQDMLAKNLVRGEYAQTEQLKTWNAQQQAANPQTNQALNQPNRNQSQAIPPIQRSGNQGSTEPSPTGKSLMDMLREDLAAEGVSDQDFAFRE